MINAKADYDYTIHEVPTDLALDLSLIHILGSGLIAVLRNENKMFHSMIYTILSLAVHIGLDVLLVEKYKLTGVAVSTAVSQFAVLVLCLCTLKIEKSAKINRAYIKDILRASSAPFGVNFVPSLVLFATNYSCLLYTSWRGLRVFIWTEILRRTYTLEYCFP